MARRLLPGSLALDALLDAVFASPRTRPFWATLFVLSGFLGGFGYGHVAGLRARFIAEHPAPPPPSSERPAVMPFTHLPTFAMGDPNARPADLQAFAIFAVPPPSQGELQYGTIELVGRLSGTNTEGLWVDGILSGTAPHPPARRGIVEDLGLFNRAFPARLADCCAAGTGTVTMSLADALAGGDTQVAELADNGFIAVAISDDFRVEKARLWWCVATHSEIRCGLSFPEPYSPPSLFDSDWGGIALERR